MSTLTLHLRIWRQNSPHEPGFFESHTLADISSHASFLEMLDILNEKLVRQGERPFEFDSDCREGICGMCSLVINGQAHGPELGTATCQLHMRKFNDGDTITIEPFRAKAFPAVRDLVVDRGSLDSIIASGGYISAKSGSHPDANVHLIPKDIADQAMDAAACIGCGACIAACPNASASLFTAAKVTHLALLPQGHAERYHRVSDMVAQMDVEKFGSCTNIGECESACPKEISIQTIAKMRREYLKAIL